jgi:hypothetical protein
MGMHLNLRFWGFILIPANETRLLNSYNSLDKKKISRNKVIFSS